MTNHYPPVAPDPLPRPAVVQRWDRLTFVHWRYDPAVVQRILPTGLEVDTFDGEAWVALVPFEMQRVRPPWGPAVPYLTTFPETNIRTYVRGPDGGRGVWFSSLEITRILSVGVARSVFHVPYTWARMRIDERGDELGYVSERLWPAPRGARSRVVVRPRGPAEATPLLEFLTNRWSAYTTDHAGRVLRAPVAHEPWPLRNADLTALDQDLVEAAGLPTPTGEPLVHYSPGVTARVGWARPV